MGIPFRWKGEVSSFVKAYSSCGVGSMRTWFPGLKKHYPTKEIEDVAEIPVRNGGGEIYLAVPLRPVLTASPGAFVTIGE
jgi:hypothetical protein